MNCPFSFGLSLRQLFYRLPDPPRAIKSAFYVLFETDYHKIA
jgi:hypothetical protein